MLSTMQLFYPCSSHNFTLFYLERKVLALLVSEPLLTCDLDRSQRRTLATAEER